MKRALLLALLLAAPLVAQHPADQVFLQSLGHSGAYRSDVWITNATRDPLSVSLIFSPVNASEGDRHFPIVRRYPGVISLLPGEPGLEIADVFDRLGISGFGLVVFNACLAGADCTPNPATGLNPNYRDISVTSRVWSGTAGTRGESFPGVEWYGYISAADPESLRHVSIGDIKNTQQLRTNLMLANVSEWSSCEMFVILFDGLGNERARKSYHLRPLENIQLSTGVEFPELNAVNRLNRQPLISSPWFRIEQAGVTPTPQAAGAYCHNGCPAFLAQGVLVDSQTLDMVKLPAQYDVPMPLGAVAVIAEPRTAGDVLRQRFVTVEVPTLVRGAGKSGGLVTTVRMVTEPREGHEPPCERTTECLLREIERRKGDR